jgi:hypothetical protein
MNFQNMRAISDIIHSASYGNYQPGFPRQYARCIQRGVRAMQAIDSPALPDRRLRGQKTVCHY